MTSLTNRGTGEDIEVPDHVTVFENSHYNVQLHRHEPIEGPAPDLLHLSIRRVDRKAVHDWRELQRVKNEVLGTDYECVELYPADGPNGRLVDTANQYHLWGYDDPTFRFPLGYPDRLVLSPNASNDISPGVTQRRFKEST